MRDADEGWLFPGRAGHKNIHGFSEQITRVIASHTGFRLTVHQMRHVAVALINKHAPGDLASASRLLGHKWIDTTAKFYSHFQTLHATERFAAIIRENLTDAEQPENRP